LRLTIPVIITTHRTTSSDSWPWPSYSFEG
jgi:hypothetical protein